MYYIYVVNISEHGFWAAVTWLLLTLKVDNFMVVLLYQHLGQGDIEITNIGFIQ